MTFEVGAVLEDAKWQAPVYCFDKKDDSESDHVFPNIKQLTTSFASLLRTREPYTGPL